MTTLTELIQKIGDENISVQLLSQSMVSSKDKKRMGDTEITFATQEITTDEIYQDSGKVGLVLWIDRDKWPC